jgi:hypothetical protein
MSKKLSSYIFVCFSWPFLLLSILLLLSFMLLPSSSYAGDLWSMDRLPPLVIDLASIPSSEIIAGKKIQSASVCANFAKMLTSNSGLWGSGPFISASCTMSKDSKTSDKSMDRTFPFWKLSISTANQRHSFALSFIEGINQSQVHSLYQIDTPVSALGILAKKSTAELLAFYLATSMPYRSIVKLSKREDGVLRIGGRINRLGRTAIPEQLSLFTLKCRNGIWIPQAIGSLKRDSKATNAVIWTADMSTIKPTGNMKYAFVQQTSARDELLNTTDQLIRDELGSFAQKFLSLGRSAYLGARYGAPIRNDSALKNAPLVGYFAEFRSGIFDGLKLNYDTVPERPLTDETGTTSLGMTRFQFGYAFGTDVRWGIFSHIDVTPKIGTTTIKATYEPVNDVTADPLEFSLTRAPTLGLEIGLEKRALSFLFRVWGFGSFSVGVLPLDRNNATSTLRGGLDVYRDLFSIKKINIAILGFGMIDSTSIVRRNISDDQLEENPSLSNSLNYKANYAGAGLTLTW